MKQVSTPYQATLSEKICVAAFALALTYFLACATGSADRIGTALLVLIGSGIGLGIAHVRGTSKNKAESRPGLVGVAASLFYAGAFTIMYARIAGWLGIGPSAFFGWVGFIAGLAIGVWYWMILIGQAAEVTNSLTGGPGRFIISGVRRDDGEETTIATEASSPAHAKAKAEQRGLVVVKIHRVQAQVKPPAMSDQ